MFAAQRAKSVTAPTTARQTGHEAIQIRNVDLRKSAQSADKKKASSKRCNN